MNPRISSARWQAPTERRRSTTRRPWFHAPEHVGDLRESGLAHTAQCEAPCRARRCDFGQRDPNSQSFAHSIGPNTLDTRGHATSRLPQHRQTLNQTCRCTTEDGGVSEPDCEAQGEALAEQGEVSDEAAAFAEHFGVTPEILRGGAGGGERGGWGRGRKGIDGSPVAELSRYGARQSEANAARGSEASASDDGEHNTGAAEAHPEHDGLDDGELNTGAAEAHPEYDGIGSWDGRVDHRGIRLRRLRVVRTNTMQSDGSVPADVHAFVSVALESR